MSSTDQFAFFVRENWAISFHLSSWILVISAVAGLAFILFRLRPFSRRWRLGDFELDRAYIGIGGHKVTVKPNRTDRQIAYSIWVEMTTRKIGQPVDLEDDVISDVYDSWYKFFGVTRELVKTVPVSKIHFESTREIIELSIEILNQGMRPHLTKWQARFRRWLDREIAQHPEKSPQEIQRLFPEYDALAQDLMEVSGKLQRYRETMDKLAKCE